MDRARATQGHDLVPRGHRRSGQARDLQLALSFLDQGSYDTTIISDGNSDTSFDESAATLSATDTLDVSIRAHGGFVAVLNPD